MLSIKSELGLQVVVHRLTLNVPEKLQLYGLHVYYVVHICDFGMLRVKDLFFHAVSINWRLQNAFVWKWDFKSTFSQEWIFLQSVRHFEIGIHLMIQKIIVSMWSTAIVFRFTSRGIWIFFCNYGALRITKLFNIGPWTNIWQKLSVSFLRLLTAYI